MTPVGSETGWSGGALDDLPCYVSEDDGDAPRSRPMARTVARLRSPTGASRGWVPGTAPVFAAHSTTTSTFGGARAGIVVVISRVVSIAPDQAETTLRQWWGDLGSGGAVAVDDELVQVGSPVHDGGWPVLCRLSADLPRSWRRSGLHLQLDVLAWSSWDTALDLRPCGSTSPTTRYFRTGHALLDRITADLRGAAVPSG